jgi:hypothetical protein
LRQNKFHFCGSIPVWSIFASSPVPSIDVEVPLIPEFAKGEVNVLFANATLLPVYSPVFFEALLNSKN